LAAEVEGVKLTNDIVEMNTRHQTERGLLTRNYEAMGSRAIAAEALLIDVRQYLLGRVRASAVDYGAITSLSGNDAAIPGNTLVHRDSSGEREEIRDRLIEATDRLFRLLQGDRAIKPSIAAAGNHAPINPDMREGLAKLASLLAEFIAPENDASPRFAARSAPLQLASTAVY
jgi:hypothetical protein